LKKARAPSSTLSWSIFFWPEKEISHPSDSALPHLNFSNNDPIHLTLKNIKSMDKVQKRSIVFGAVSVLFWASSILNFLETSFR
jgi:hypothetical protein